MQHFPLCSKPSVHTHAMRTATLTKGTLQLHQLQHRIHELYKLARVCANAEQSLGTLLTSVQTLKCWQLLQDALLKVSLSLELRQKA